MKPRMYWLVVPALILAVCGTQQNQATITPPNAPTSTPSTSVGATLPPEATIAAILATNAPSPTKVGGYVYEIAYIEGGEGIFGRTAEEIEEDYTRCVYMVEQTQQEPAICQPKLAIFGDVPTRKATIKDFFIDKKEAANPNGFPMEVTFEEAKEICSLRRGRLPTADEWEYAARGQEGRIWPWGDETYWPGRANIDMVGGQPANPVTTVGYYPSGATPEGILDMTGNVWEWVIGDWTPDQGWRKGGSAGSYPPFARPAHVLYSGDKAGFRCVYDIDPR